MPILIFLLLALSAWTSGVAAGQTTQPAPASDQALEDQPLRVTDSEVRAATIHSAGSSAFTTGTSDLSHIAIALLVVICLILLLRAGFRHLTNGAGVGRGTKLVTVLSRSILSPKQQVLVLQVGKRLLVVGDSGGHMSSLCEISDPDEIAALVGQTRQTSSAPKAAFGSLFRRANEPFGDTDALQSPAEESTGEINPDDAVSAEEVGGLLDKVRMLQQQFNDAKQPQS
jgi:flagellar biogenesis protein FliO